MSHATRSEFTAAQGRRFAFTVAAALVVFAGVAWWRGHPTAVTVLASLGAALGAAGLLFPSRLGPVERAWMGLAHAISRVTTPIVMGVMYGAVLSPVGMLRRTFGGNPLVHDERDKSYWRERPAGKRRSASMQRQF